MTNHILFSTSYDNQVANIVLNRPKVHNAFDLTMINQLNQHINYVSNDSNIKILVITANGNNFSAGADLNWMQQSINYTQEQNLQDAQKLANMLLNLYNLTKPIICGVQGNVYGGAIGILACADLVIAANNCNFCFPEVKLGLAPAIISQFVLKIMDISFAKYHMLTAKLFNAKQALQSGLVNQISSLELLSQNIIDNIEHLLTLDANALIATKKLIRYGSPEISIEKLNMCTQIIADLRISPTTQALIKKYLSFY